MYASILYGHIEASVCSQDLENKRKIKKDLDLCFIWACGGALLLSRSKKSEKNNKKIRPLFYIKVFRRLRS
jgi:hypothetical protein